MSEEKSNSEKIVTVTLAEQLRANRQHALNAWLGGMDENDPRFPRWPGDDGRSISLVDYQFWPQERKDAEQAEFSRLDAIYEKAKSES